MGTHEVRSLEEFYETYSRPVFAFLLRLSLDRQLAEDLTGETFYRAIMALDSFRGEASLKTWLLSIARNLYLRRIRSLKRTTSLDKLEEGGRLFSTDDPDPESRLIQRQESEMVQRALLSLAETDRSVLLLVAEGALDYRDIAEVLHISVAAVKVRIYRARRRLVDALRREGHQGRKGTHNDEEGENAQL
jgi:RNA polymerase sigma-70 factor (ECF subfamily)